MKDNSSATTMDKLIGISKIEFVNYKLHQNKLFFVKLPPQANLGIDYRQSDTSVLYPEIH